MPLDAITPGTATVEIPISRVVHRQDLYPRSRHDPGTVERYASLTTPAPPIRVNQDFVGIDYRHRMLAALERGETTITASVVRTRDDKHLLDLAVQMNFDHGLALSREDRQRLAIMRYNPDAGHFTEQKRVIAAWLRVHYDTVNNWLQEADHTRRQLRNAQIRELAAQGLSQDRIAAQLGCSKGLVNLKSAVRNSGFRIIDRLPYWVRARVIRRLAVHKQQRWYRALRQNRSTSDRQWGRTCYAFDRKPRPARAGDIEQHDILVDGLLPPVPWDDVTLVFIDPPYAAQAAGQYSDDPTDLAHVTLDEFEQVLANLINALGNVLPAGAAICLLIRNTQWHAPGHRIRRHDRNIEDLVTLDFEREIFCPLGRNPTTTQRAWAEETRDCLVISRKLLVWRV